MARNLYVYVPPGWLPTFHGLPRLNQMLQQARLQMVKSFLRSLGYAEQVVYVWDPELAGVLSGFPDSTVVYHVYDEKRKFDPDWIDDASKLELGEALLLGRADVIFAVSEVLKEGRKDKRPDILVVPNGVSEEFLRPAATREPREMLGIPRPRVGYIGAVTVKLDAGLLLEIARRRRDWSVVVVGPEMTGRDRQFHDTLRALEREPNAYSFGFRPRAELPGYVDSLDVGLLCYRTETWARYGSPLKLYEFYARGKPIVASDIPALEAVEPPVRIASDPGEWLDSIEEALACDSLAEAEARRRAARSNTWDRKVVLIEQKIADAVAARRANQGPAATLGSRVGSA